MSIDYRAEAEAHKRYAEWLTSDVIELAKRRGDSVLTFARDVRAHRIAAAVYEERMRLAERMNNYATAPLLMLDRIIAAGDGVARGGGAVLRDGVMQAGSAPSGADVSSGQDHAPPPAPPAPKQPHDGLVFADGLDDDPNPPVTLRRDTVLAQASAMDGLALFMCHHRREYGTAHEAATAADLLRRDAGEEAR